MKKFKIVLILFFPLFIRAQSVYVDPTTTAALAGHALVLKNGQNKITEEQSKLKKAQALISSQMALVNQVQDKVYKGLSEVSGTLSNGMQVKSIMSDLERCRVYSKNISELVKRNPQYAVFGKASAEKSYEQILKIGSEVSSAIKAGGDNLMTAGDRYKLLDSIEWKIRGLRMWLVTVQMALENAERIGFWRSINPFQGYLNKDKDIVENIMHKYKNNF